MNFEKLINLINISLDNLKITDDLPPIDGIAVAVAVWYLTPPEDRLKNVLIVGSIHYFLHEIIIHRAIRGEQKRNIKF